MKQASCIHLQQLLKKTTHIILHKLRTRSHEAIFCPTAPVVFPFTFSPSILCSPNHPPSLSLLLIIYLFQILSTVFDWLCNKPVNLSLRRGRGTFPIVSMMTKARVCFLFLWACCVCLNIINRWRLPHPMASSISVPLHSATYMHLIFPNTTCSTPSIITLPP